jgi:hypothetical protein
MNLKQPYFFRLYVPALIFSVVTTEFVERLFETVKINETLSTIYPSWFSYLLYLSFLSIILFVFVIIGCLFSNILPSLWEKSRLNKHIGNLNNYSVVLQRIFYIFMFLVFIFALFYPFSDVIIKSYDANFSLGDSLESILSGIVLALLFFLLREKCFAYPDLNNQWYLKSITEESSYNDYKDMELHHQLFLVQDKSQIKGTAEKYYEDSSIGKKGTHIIHYSAQHRRRAYIEGTIQKNYFGPDILILHAIENGEKRQSTIYCRIEIKRQFIIGPYNFSKKGLFYSMVSNQKGYVVLSKEKFEMKDACIDPKILKKLKKNDPKNNDNFFLNFLKFVRVTKK